MPRAGERRAGHGPRLVEAIRRFRRPGARDRRGTVAARPRTLLERVRRQFTALFVLVTLLGILDLTRLPDLSTTATVTFIAGHLALALWGVGLYRTGGRHPSVDLLVPILIALIGAAAGDYDQVFPRLYLAVFLSGLYGPPRRAVGAAAMFLLGYEAAVYATHGVAGFTLAQLGSNVVGVAAVTYAMQTLGSVLEQQELAARQEATLATASGSLLSARTVDEVADAALVAVSELVDPENLRGTHVSLWRQEGEALLRVGLRGESFGPAELPLGALSREVAAAYRSGVLLELDADQMRRAGLALGSTRTFAQGLVVPALASGIPLGALFVASHEAFDGPVASLLERFVHEVALADVLVRRSHLLSAVVERSADGILLVSRHGRIEFASRATARLAGRPVATLIGEPVGSLLLRTSGEGHRPVGSLAEVESYADQLGIAGPDGHRQIEATVSPIGADGVVLNLRDVTRRRVLEDELAHVALHDLLTDLPNRRMFFDRLTHAVHRNERYGSLLAVAIVDLDGFKNVNDRLGHEAGDGVLTETATRLRRGLRRGDTAARLGADEFAILLEDLASTDDARAMLERLVEDLSAPLELPGATIVLSASIGVSVGDDVHDHLQDADIALTAAKEAGKGQVVVFEEEEHGQAREEVVLRTELRTALDSGELRLEYQPIVDVPTARVIGFEALLRWDHPRRGAVPPCSFIRVAESTGIVVALGRWVLTEACRQLVAWRARSESFDDLTMSVNVSAIQLLDPGFAELVLAALTESRLDASSLTLEITETALMKEPEQAGQVLAELREFGVRVAVDDFGTGYSSFAYLQRFPVDVIKIDRGFVAEITEGGEHAALAQGIVNLAQSLHIDTTAEGVERAEQLELLRDWNCTSAQGWFWARSMPPASIPGWLTRVRDVGENGCAAPRPGGELSTVAVEPPPA
jgi:diguanylate cyclase (GGDEF)-like protein